VFLGDPREVRPRRNGLCYPLAEGDEALDPLLGHVECFFPVGLDALDFYWVGVDVNSRHVGFPIGFQMRNRQV